VSQVGVLRQPRFEAAFEVEDLAICLAAQPQTLRLVVIGQ
jgi:hypothetical protein